MAASAYEHLTARAPDFPFASDLRLTTIFADDRPSGVSPSKFRRKSDEQSQRAAPGRKDERGRGEGLRRLSLRENVRALEGQGPGRRVHDAAPRRQAAAAGDAAILQKLGALLARSQRPQCRLVLHSSAFLREELRSARPAVREDRRRAHLAAASRPRARPVEDRRGAETLEQEVLEDPYLPEARAINDFTHKIFMDGSIAELWGLHVFEESLSHWSGEWFK